MMYLHYKLNTDVYSHVARTFPISNSGISIVHYIAFLITTVVCNLSLVSLLFHNLVSTSNLNLHNLIPHLQSKISWILQSQYFNISNLNL